MSERDFWHQVRRGLMQSAAAPDLDGFRRGLGQVIAAIEKRYPPSEHP